MDSSIPCKSVARSGTLIAIILITIPLLTLACSRGDESAAESAGDVEMEIQVTPDPPATGPATIEVVLRDSEGDPLTGANLEVTGDMTHAGMQPVTSETGENEDGHYVTEDFEFTMGGDWVITVSGQLDDGTEIERTFDLSGVDG